MLRSPRLATPRRSPAGSSPPASLALASRFALGAVAALAGVTALAACGPKAKPGGGPTGPVAVPIPEGPGCPAAAAVHLAVYRPAQEGSPGGWTLPLANRLLEDDSAPPGYRALDAAAAQAAAIPPPPPRLWLMPPGGAPCQATPGAFYAETINDGQPNELLGVQLTTSCAAPAQDGPDKLLALVADVAPTGCVIIGPRPVAGRVGEYDEKGTSWQILRQSTPLPPALEAVVEQRPCEAPCERLWAVDQLDFAGKPIAWDVTLEWLQRNPAEPDFCKWPRESTGGLWFADAAGAAQRLPADLDHDFHLGAMLADRSGPKVVFLETIGEYSTLDLPAGAPPQLGRNLRWFHPHEEDHAGDRQLGPYCGP